MFHRILWMFGVMLIIFSIFLDAIKSVGALNNIIQSSQDFSTDVEFYNNIKGSGRSIFVYRKNGIRLEIRLVSGVNDSSNDEEDDRFPMLPINDLIYCVMNVSIVCVENKIAQYINTISRLDKIILLGSIVKFVKVREPLKKVSNHQVMDSDFVGEIDRSIDNFFNKFALRITLFKWNERKEQYQIDFMFDDSDLVEGRGKGGGGGGGKSGKCKQMMMCMMMALKMNMLGMMGLMMMKGLMMSGMFLMMTKAMLVMKFMESKSSGKSGDQIKKIVVLTKGSSGSDCSSCHGPPPHSNYGGPPSSPVYSEYHSGW